jgi:dihydroorotate dehydrogenase
VHLVESFARLDRTLRPLLVRLPAPLAVRLYSRGRRLWLAALRAPRHFVAPPAELGRSVWGLHFRSPLGNAAGLFKEGTGGDLAAAWGAGSWLVGTSTGQPRRGNLREGVFQPFAPYPRSRAASNWLGLPNPGHAAVAARLASAARVPGMPRGASLAIDPLPDIPEADRLASLVEGLEHYDRAGVDFLEINESCPNTGEVICDGLAHLEARLSSIASGFLARRRRRLPVLLKLSNDADPAAVGDVVRLASRLGFDGLVLGNTSTRWSELREAIDPTEQPLYDNFVGRFGGGVSGLPVRARSLDLLRAAAAALPTARPQDEFHLVQVGGIHNAADVAASLAAGATLCQWYTGLFEAFSQHGHNHLAHLHTDLVRHLQESP